MNAKELLIAARKQADYGGSMVALLEAGRDAQKQVVAAFQGDDRKNAIAFLSIIRDAIDSHPEIARPVISLVAFEIQIDNARAQAKMRTN